MNPYISQLIQYGWLNPTEVNNDERVEDAISKYRDFMQVTTLDLDSLFSIERCGCPDISPLTGSGSWPVGCHQEWPSNHSFAVYFTESTRPQHWNNTFQDAWDLVISAYSDIGIAFFETTNRSKANTIVTWQRGAGWIGLAIVPNSPRCGQQIWAKYDNSYGSSFSRERMVNQFAYLMAHEFGHNMGLGHTRGGIMNASLTNGTFSETQWRNDPAYSTLRRWFGGEPIAPTWSIPQPEQPRDE